MLSKNKANKELKIWSRTLRKRIYDMRSATPGNQEQIIIERPQQGRLPIIIYRSLFGKRRLSMIIIHNMHVGLLCISNVFPKSYKIEKLQWWWCYCSPFCYILFYFRCATHLICPFFRYYIVLYGYEDYRDVGFEAESRWKVHFLISFIPFLLRNTQDIWAHSQMLLVS